MRADDVYYTIRNTAQSELKVKGSRFIGNTVIVSSRSDAEKELAVVRKIEHAASHHCFAYVTGPGIDKEFKYSDDGEPSGTAGRPIYNQLVGRDLTNVLLVVTRYFGGTKLGTGGLVRAYSETAQNVLDSSGRQEHFICEQLRLVVELSLYDRVQRLLSKIGANVTDSKFAEKATIEIDIRKSQSKELRSQLVQLSGARIAIEKID